MSEKTDLFGLNESDYRNIKNIVKDYETLNGELSKHKRSLLTNQLMDTMIMIGVIPKAKDIKLKGVDKEK